MIKFWYIAAVSVICGYSAVKTPDIKPTKVDVVPLKLEHAPEPVFLVVPTPPCDTEGVAIEEAAKRCFKTLKKPLYM
tara:strand:+ start:3697 stop:3927 length:231 start_codon:yes stop_codon:yes gene_type:complete